MTHTSNMAIDEFVARTRQLTGQQVNERSPWNTAVTADAIRHFAYGISDDNPLWLDADYAAKSQYGCQIAPPAFLTSVLYPILHGAPLNVPMLNLIGELEYQWFQPILKGDRLSAAAKQLDVFESKDRAGRRAVYIVAETSYWNQNQTLVGKATGTLVRVDTEDSKLLVDRSIYQYSPKELAAIEQALKQETRTGQKKLFGTDVQIGQQLPPIVRGPLTIGDMIGWQAAIGPAYRAGALGYLDGLKAPHTMVKHPVTGWAVKNSQQHEDFLLASQRGMPAPFDNGVMRFAWLSPLLTNWMGDAGALTRLSAQIIAPNLYGDTTWYSGAVSGKIETGRGVIVKIKIAGVNQLGVTTTTGSADVLLPARKPVRPASRRKTDSAASAPTEPEAVHHLIEAQARQTPEAISLIFEGQHLTYRQLNRQANQLARYLQSLKVGPGTPVGVCLTRSAELAVAILAVLKAGGCYVPLDPEYPPERLVFMLTDAQLPILLTQTDVLPNLPPHPATVICLDSSQRLYAGQQTDNLNIKVTPNQWAYIIYTSGSTHQPKGAAVPHGSLARYIQAIQKALAISEDDVYLHTASFSFSASVRQMFLPLFAGAALLITNVEQQQDPVALFELIKRSGATVWDTVPSVWRYAIDTLSQIDEARRRKLLDNRLRLILTTGEALPWSVPQRWQSLVTQPPQFINLYSQSETAGTVCYYPLPRQIDGETGVVPLGQPVDYTAVYLLDEQLKPVAQGAVGEICVGGPRLAAGYINHPELTAERFVAGPFVDAPAARLYKTRDLGRYLPDGNLEYVGRLDNQVKVRGFRVWPAEIEMTLRQHHLVKEVVVLGRQDSAGETQIVAYITSVPGESVISVGELRHFLSTKVPAYMLPSAFVFLEQFPLTPNGKIDRRALPPPDRAVSAVDAAESVRPRNPTEKIIAEVWADILDLEQVDIHADFFESGGHSLKGAQLVARLHEIFRVDLSLRQLFENPTIAALAAAIEEFQNAPAVADDDDKPDLDDALRMLGEF